VGVKSNAGDVQSYYERLAHRFRRGAQRTLVARARIFHTAARLALQRLVYAVPVPTKEEYAREKGILRSRFYGTAEGLEPAWIRTGQLLGAEDSMQPETVVFGRVLVLRNRMQYSVRRHYLLGKRRAPWRTVAYHLVRGRMNKIGKTALYGGI